MKLNGYSIDEKTIASAKIERLGNYNYLSLHFLNSDNKTSDALQFCKLNIDDLKAVHHFLFSCFNVDSMEKLVDRKVFCLSSSSHVLCMINPENFSTFSLNSILKKDKEWIENKLNIHYALENSKLSQEQVINLSLIKTALDNKTHLNSLDTIVLKKIDNIILINKLEKELINTESNYSKFKL